MTQAGAGHLTRRDVLGLLALGAATGLQLRSLQAQSAELPSLPMAQALKAWRTGGWVLVMRHEQTVPGLGDPPGFRLDQCATQRNLSAQGIERARALGEQIRQGGVRFSQVRSSQWCRCVDTAKAMLGDSQTVQVWAPLNSFFDDRSTAAAQTQELRAAMRALGSGEVWLWVTHQVNITALTGVVPAMGEGLALRMVQGPGQPVPEMKPEFRWHG
jgi:phosphohistidine phosphatase SixA